MEQRQQRAALVEWFGDLWYAVRWYAHHRVWSPPTRRWQYAGLHWPLQWLWRLLDRGWRKSGEPF
jgi:hypothetical protein